MTKRILALIGLVALGGLLFWGGTVFAQTTRPGPGWQSGPMMSYAGGMGAAMPHMANGNRMSGYAGSMANHMTGQGAMMSTATMGGHMMGSMWSADGSEIAADPITIETAAAAVIDYLASLDDPNLSLGEIMIFTNHAYAQVRYEDTGAGAFEVLVDPVSGRVYPEPGPNMMWNTDYGMMSGQGGHGMMAYTGSAGDDAPVITAAEAIEIAQTYLDSNQPGSMAETHADGFPGYYTLHVLQDGAIDGMLSVNAFTGQVFSHHWHGDFVEMSDLDHE